MIQLIRKLFPLLICLFLCACGSESAGADAYNVVRAFPKLKFTQPLYLTTADDGSQRLFVVERPGRIKVFAHDQATANASVFLDISGRVRTKHGEEGLLGLAFHPEYEENGQFFVYYSTSDPRRTRLSRFAVSAADPNRADASGETILLEIAQPWGNHNGGQILFGRDGYLYAGIGDGGSGGDPKNSGQSPDTLLGSILRIDVDKPADGKPYGIPADNPFADGGKGRPEVWAWGLRNPWRFSQAPGSDKMWVGDVGQNKYEEITLVGGGENHGWNIMEGKHEFRVRGRDQDDLIAPVVEYSHRQGVSVTGGYVYRGQHCPTLANAYIYGDFGSGRIWALRYDHEAGKTLEEKELLKSRLQISSFGEGPQGELYILNYFGGEIHRLVEK